MMTLTKKKRDHERIMLIKEKMTLRTTITVKKKMSTRKAIVSPKTKAALKKTTNMIASSGSPIFLVITGRITTK